MHKFLGYRHFAGGAALQLAKEETDESVTVQVSPIFDTDNGELIVALAEKGWGVALMPKFLVSDDVESGRLVAILEDWKAPEIWLTAFYPPYEMLPEKVAVFTSFVEDMVKACPGILD